MATRYYLACAHEQFRPDELLQQAAAGEAAGFDGICCSDHFQPWFEPGESGQAWVWLGAAGAVTERVALGPAVTPPIHRYHPALVAQMIATLEVLNPGRAFLGVGSGESLNETPLGMDWPHAEEQLERLEEALLLIGRLLDGERVTGGRYFPTDGAYLYTRPERRPPIYVSAFNPEAARLAGLLGDGLWTLADPEQAPQLVERYHEGCAEAGKEPGEVLLQTGFSWARDDDAAFEAAERWRATMPPDFYVDDWHEPRLMEEESRRRITDDQVRENFLIGSDPAEHVERIRELEQLGATIVVLLNLSAAAPLDAIRVYGEQVVPALRAGTGARQSA
jgi:coenzyme F420-dependent glucose-6-phosphate dehydrogenase